VSEASDMVEALNGYNQEFDQRCLERHEMGEKKYGAGTWMNVDNFEMAIEEVIDLSNYVRFTFIKLRMLQDNLQDVLAAKGTTAKPKPGNEMMGKDALQKGLDQ